ncbi:uncharacterized protein TRAVEDRAFT_73062 [Trametes versicolor FP-101664 SS1]|uniref:uncharacterized protein n=1 Tax=Trametes versicolor (strain FP-101664) TaxID=717944 RepID=UPI0004621F93|nr:uncharacterized protein TRAVEDRAFT_73062 [Trametes versicolor FP-101664 SS1]EIW56515.1 hypothetical protein TRAVEDRAFT_73062 [Trametes versicolor FP-101664 SS1]
MASEDCDYPWLVTDSDGNFDLCAIPDRLLRHPEIQRRGIVLTDVLKPGAVFSTLPQIDPVYVVKIIDISMEELAIYQRLLRELRCPNNHTLPCEITLNGHPLLIMPWFYRFWGAHCDKETASTLVDIIYQLVEGLEYLHSLHIVHMDMCMDNLLAANRHHAAQYTTATADRMYIIDFDSSRQFALGPGVQRAITLPETQVRKPNGLKRLDPYSWDVYCTGRTLEAITRFRYQSVTEAPHSLAQSFIQWLIGDERGCTGVCRCRPTARNALKVALVLRWAFWSAAPEDHTWVFDALSGLWTDNIDAP